MKESIRSVIKGEMMRKCLLIVGVLSLLALSSTATPRDETKRFVEHLDAYFLPPFQKVMDKFGMGRLAPKSRGHTTGQMFVPESLALFDSEQKGRALAHEAQKLGLELRVGMFHLRPVPDAYAKSGFADFNGPDAEIFVMSPYPVKAPKTLEQTQREEENRLNDAILFKLNQARSGKNVTFSEKGWKFVLRPIRAESAACLSCHTDAKKGETLGALVYMIRQSATVTPAKALLQ